MISNVSMELDNIFAWVDHTQIIVHGCLEPDVLPWMVWRKLLPSSVAWKLVKLSDCHLVKLKYEDQAGRAGVVEGQHEDAEHPGRTADEARDHAPQALLLIVQLTVSLPVWKSTHAAHTCVSSLECKTTSDIVNAIHDDSLTYDTPIEHPGSHQQEGEQEEDEVMMVPRSWNRRARSRWKMASLLQLTAEEVSTILQQILATMITCHILWRKNANVASSDGDRWRYLKTAVTSGWWITQLNFS